MAIERRYQLLPLYYTLFRDASLTGVPVVRPLFFADPTNPRLRTVDDGFLIGPDLLAWCQVDENARTEPVLPRGVWRPIGLAGAGHPELPEMFIRGGGIVPTGPIVQFAGEKPLDPLTLHVCLDAAGSATGSLYEDAGNGWAHRRGDYLRSVYTASTEGDVVTVELASERGDRPRPDRTLIVRLIGPDGVRVASGRDGDPITIRLSRP
jgi:alpha-glucosidase